VRDGEVADGEALTEALRDLWSQHSWLDRKVRIGVANARIVVRVMELPPIENPKDLAVAVEFQAKDALPMPLDQAVVDFQPIGIVETPNGPRARVVLVAARRDMIERLLASVRAAGLRPEGIDLAERQGLTLDHARAWLTHVGLVDPVEDIDGEAAIVADARAVLTDGARRVANDVRASLDFHQAQSAVGQSVGLVLLTGPAVAVPGFAEVLERELGLSIESRVLAGPADLEAARLSVAAGLAVEECAA
jgi:type IV pilus assembly protein PilM